MESTIRVLDDDLLQIAAKATCLRERFQGRFVEAGADEDACAVARLNRWMALTTHGDEVAFARHLAWEGWPQAPERLPLGVPRVVDASEAPEWIWTLDALLRQAEGPSSGAERFFSPEFPVAFEHVLAPMVVCARAMLAARLQTSCERVAGSAHADLERGLLLRLEELSSRVFASSFSLFRLFNGGVSASSAEFESPRNAPAPADSVVPESRELYCKFVEHMKSGGLRACFCEYPVLARLIVKTVDYWVDETFEFLMRLEADWTSLEHAFEEGASLGQVLEIDPALSDSHHHGRFVKALVFSSGRALIYKPKDLRLERGFQALLSWVNTQGLAPQLKPRKLVCRPSHGWVEFVRFRPLEVLDQVRAYHRRLGMLLGLLHVLEGTDCHKENLIADGQHPTLVDFETLMHHRAVDLDGKGADDSELLADDRLAGSVLNIGLLPRWEQVGSGGVIDVSAMGATEDYDSRVEVTVWADVNCDAMRRVRTMAAVRPQANVARWHGRNVPPSEFGDEIVAGFEAVHRCMRQHRDGFLSEVLSRFQDLSSRFIFRHTRIYARVQDRLLSPKYLKDGADRSIELDVLCRPFLWAAERPALWPLLRQEREALEQLDVPCFEARVSEATLDIGPGVPLVPMFKSGSLEQVKRKIQTLGDEDERAQVAYIRGSLFAFVAREPKSLVQAVDGPTDLERGQDDVTDDCLWQGAKAIAELLKQEAIAAGDGSMTWIGMNYMPESQRFQLNRLSQNLYNGNSGVALFLAAFAAESRRSPEGASGVLGDTYRTLAHAAMKASRALLSAERTRKVAAKTIGIGGSTGIGSILYSLLCASRFLDDATMLDDAHAVADLMGLDVIRSDTRYDVMSGAAGAVLALLALHQVSPRAALVERAVEAGHHLLSARIASEHGHLVWRTLRDNVLTGMSHGAAGIALALLKLYQVSGEPEFMAGAKEAIGFERSVYSPADKNWPDFRTAPPAYMCSWCHGAVGIGLARLAGLDVLDDEAVRADVGRALESARAEPVHGVDHVCCGSFGHVELFLDAGVRLDRPDLEELARRRAASAIRRAGSESAYTLFAGLPRTLRHPGFFQGLAGIGYQLLRLRSPRLLPSVLQLAPPVTCASASSR